MISLLSRFRRAALQPRHPPAPPAAADLADDAPAGCGWFDSSADLRRGLVVAELPVSVLAEGSRRRLQSGNELVRH